MRRVLCGKIYEESKQIFSLRKQTRIHLFGMGSVRSVLLCVHCARAFTPLDKPTWENQPTTNTKTELFHFLINLVLHALITF